ncbi:MAG: DUF655 domain-containing protein [Euryarchaeota archaeon]|jgi:putative nucleotide binding protein|nr:DUF655 domain-containing protein [Euryarchaeota archaeon]
MSDADHDGETIVLDYLPHGRADDDRPGYQKPPIAFVLDTKTFALSELTLTDDSGIKIGDYVDLDASLEGVETVRSIGYDDLSGGARSELEYVIEDLIEEEEDRFVTFYNDAQPITLRLHQLNLLPGIGKKLRNSILDERKREPFGSFEELDDRVSGLHNPQSILADRILEELRENELKYRLFVREE